MLTFHFEFEFYNDSIFSENITALQNKIGFLRKYPILLFCSNQTADYKFLKLDF